MIAFLYVFCVSDLTQLFTALAGLLVCELYCEQSDPQLPISLPNARAVVAEVYPWMLST